MRPKVVVLSGSIRFRDLFDSVEQELVLRGNTVLSCCWAFDERMLGTLVKKALDQQHKNKILLADELHVLNKGGYIGESTRNEIEFAKEQGVNVVYMEPVE